MYGVRFGVQVVDIAHICLSVFLLACSDLYLYVFLLVYSDFLGQVWKELR